MKKTLFLLPLLFAFSGCTYTATPITSLPTGDTRRISKKNYTLGQEAVVYVGKPLVLVKEYVVIETESSLQASNHFTITGGLSTATVNVSGSQEQIFPIVGSLNVDGITCKTIKILGSRFVFGIKPDGSFSGAATSFDCGSSPIQGVNVYKLNPPETRFYSVVTQRVLENAPYTNMEIIYSGLSNDTLHLLYREYTPKDLIRPAFTQELSYPSDTKTVRFRDLKIEVKEISSEKLVCSVVED